MPVGGEAGFGRAPSARLPAPDGRRALVSGEYGGNGVVYTQITDLEGELNGLLTHDRKVLKADAGRLRAAHAALIRGAEDGTLGCTTP